MKNRTNIIKFCLLLFYLLLSTDSLSQKVNIDNSIIIDTSLIDINHEITSSELLHMYNVNTLFYALNDLDYLYFHIIKAIDIKDIKSPLDTFSLFDFLSFCDEKFQSTATESTQWQFNPRFYIEDFIFNNLYLKVLNDTANEINYYKVNFAYFKNELILTDDY